MFSTHFLDIPALDSASGTVTLPGSKSISNRVLLLASLSQGTTELQDLLDSDDTRVMLNALRALGCQLQADAASLKVTGINGKVPDNTLDLFMGNAGTAMRPLTAALALIASAIQSGRIAPRLNGAAIIGGGFGSPGFFKALAWRLPDGAFGFRRGTDFRGGDFGHRRRIGVGHLPPEPALFDDLVAHVADSFPDTRKDSGE